MWIVRLVIYLGKKTFDYAHNALVVIAVAVLLALWGYNTVAPPDKDISFEGIVESLDNLNKTITALAEWAEARPWEVE